MKVTVAKMDIKAGEPIRFFLTGDWHVGNVNFDEDSAGQLVKLVKESKKDVDKTFLITMGDLAELVCHSDVKRFVPSTVASRYTLHDLNNMPVAQVDHIHDLFGEILPYTIARLTGNHEGEYKKRHHIDIHEMVFRRIARTDGTIRPDGVEYTRGDGDLGYIGFLRTQYNISSVRQSVDFCLNHGDGGSGYREGYPINKAHDVFRWSDADIGAMGHIHQLAVDCKEHHILNLYGRYTTTPRWKGITGTLLRTAKEGTANYFEHKGRAGGNVGCLMAEIRFYSRRIDGRAALIRDITLEPISFDLPKWKYRA